MKKLLRIFLLLLFTLLINPSNLSAQSITKILSPNNGPDVITKPTYSPSFVGQDQNYSVVFRGNGEAVVNARFNFFNFSENALEKIELRVPKVNPTDISAFQVILEPYCLRYDYQSPMEYDYNTGQKYNCLEYQEPDYFNPYSSQGKYQKAKADLQGDTITVTLPKPVQSQSGGSYILYYRTIGYAKKDFFQTFKFEFETLKVDDKVRNLTVGISTDSDLILKGAGGNVNYRFTDDIAQLRNVGSATEGKALPAFDNYYRNIGRGTITKNAYELQPLDSYTVKGSYAASYLSLYSKEVITVISIILIAIILVYLVIRRLLTRKSAIPNNVSNTNVNFSNFLKITGLGFLVAILTLILTLAVLFVSNMINNAPYEARNILGILFIVISFLLYLLIIIAPCIFIGMRKGFWWGVGLLASIIIMLTLFTLVAVLLIFLTRTQFTPYPYPDLYNGSVTR